MENTEDGNVTLRRILNNR